MISYSEHQEHLAEALEKYYDQHGDEKHWTAYECECHDKLVHQVNVEDGYSEE